MSSELSSLNPAVTTDRSVGSGTSLNNQIQLAEIKPTTAIVGDSNFKQNPLTAPLEIEEAQKEQQESTKAKESSEKTEEKATINSMSASELKEALDEINSALYSYNRSLRFELHEETDDLVVKVFNTKTDEVIRQYPSAEVLERRAKLLAGDTNFFSAKVY